MYIYKITNNINNKGYVGQTTQDCIEKRWSNHKSEGKFAIGQAIDKYGPENFTFEVIDKASDMDDLNKKEIEYIATLDTMAPNGYNLHEGGRNSRLTQETKDKISKAHMGKIISETSKLKMASKAIQRWENIAYREEMGLHLKSMFKNEKTALKHRQSQANRWLSSENRDVSARKHGGKDFYVISKSSGDILWEGGQYARLR